MAKKPIDIASVHYKKKGDVLDRLSKLLWAGATNQQITEPDDIALLSALFHVREDKVRQLEGRKIVGWGREATTVGRCFAAFLSDGSKLHFSMGKSLKAAYAAGNGGKLF